MNLQIRVTALVALAAAVALVPARAATITVDSVEPGDVDDAICTLAEAIVAANSDDAYHGCAAGSGFDQIEFDLPSGATILATIPLPPIRSSLAIAGPGREELTIDGGSLARIFLVDSLVDTSPIQLEIRDLTLAHGGVVYLKQGGETEIGGAITVGAGDAVVARRVVFSENFAAAGGGALRVVGSAARPAGATIDDCFFEGNYGGTGGGGAIYLERAIGIVRRSTFFVNETDAEPGGGVARGGGAIAAYDSTLAVRTSTFYLNFTLGSGGALLAVSLDPAHPDDISITDSTIFDNVGDGDGDDLGNVGGVAIAAVPGDSSMAAEIGNTLIAKNVDPGSIEAPDLFVSGTGIDRLGHSLIGANPGIEAWFPVGAPNENGDYVGTLDAPLEPHLGPFGDWGGSTPVLPPLSTGTSVIDLGKCVNDGSDQRGYVNASTGRRPVDDPAFPNPSGGDGCDIGAVEAGAEPPDTSAIFGDGFETGDAVRWSLVVP